MAMQEPSIQFKKEMRAASIVSAVILALLFIRTIFEQSWPIRNDCAMYIRCAELLLQGQTPYVQFCDINPPLIMYLMTIPVALAKLFHVDVILLFNIFIMLLIVGSWLTLRALFKSQRQHPAAPFFPNILVAFALANFFTGEWHEYGQRDHLFILALVPFFFLRAKRWQALPCNNLAATANGAMVALALCMRPYNIFLLAASEIFWFTTKRKFKAFFVAETASALIVALAYLGSLFTILPAPARLSWTQHIMPIVVRGYQTYDQPFTAMLLLVALYGVLPCWLLCLALGFKQKIETLTAPLTVLGLAGILLYILEFKPWANHLLEGMAACCMLLAVQIQALAARKVAAKKTLIRTFIILITLLFFMPYALVQKSFPQFDLSAERALILKETTEQDSVMVLSTILPNAYPTILQTGRRDGGRYFFLFPLSMITYCRSKEPAPKEAQLLESEENNVIDQLKEDLSIRKPKLVLIDEEPNNLCIHVSMLDYLERHHFVSDMLKDYERVGTCKAASNLAVFKRKTF